MRVHPLSVAIFLVVVVAGRSHSQPQTLTLVGTTEPGSDPLGPIQFGADVAFAGDVNGDGLDDLIVGAPFEVTGGSWDGQAYLFYGGSPPNAAPDASLTGFPRDEQFGLSVSPAGDVNADGFDDFLVGSPMSDLPRENAGRVFLYLGKDAPLESADLILASGTLSDHFGSAMDGGGDFNGDGFSDIVITGVASSTPEVSSVYFGNSTPDAIPDLAIGVPSGGELLDIGRVQWAGDVNGDGYDDLLFAGTEGFYPTATTFIAVCYGGDIPDAEPDVIVHNADPMMPFAVVSPAGDFDGDGFDDVVVSTVDLKEDAFIRVEVYRGGESSLRLLATFLPPTDFFGSGFGAGLASAGDVDGDGFDDVLVAEPGWRVYLYSGDESPAVVPSRKYADPEAQGGFSSGGFGRSLDGAGDIDGDGAADVVVGAPNALAPYPDPQLTRPGKAVVFHAGPMVIAELLDPAHEVATRGALAVSPHPVRGGVASRIAVPTASDLRVDIVDVRGRVVASLDDGIRRSSDTTWEWDGRDAQGRMSVPGVYFLRAHSDEKGLRESRRVVLMR